MHTLRALLPPPAALPTTRAALVQVCGRRSSTAAYIRVGARVAFTRELGARRREHGGNAERLVAESFRSWIVSTFRGVSWRWLRAYVLEATTRWRVRELTADVLVERLLAASDPITFRQARVSFE